jgi:PEP-CTERM motif
MKLRSFAAIIAAGCLVAAAGPSYAAKCNTILTLAAWSTSGGCQDNFDQDTTWTWTGGTIAGAIGPTRFSVIEVTIGGFDFYALNLDYTSLAANDWIPSGTSTLTYDVQQLGNESFSAANFDNTVQGTGGLATKVVAGLTLTSTNGSRDPAQGETPFPTGPQTLIHVTDTWQPSPNAIYTSSNNSFTTQVPEPVSLALVGLGLTAMGLVRRKRKLT